MLGVDLHKETFYRTTQLEHREVKELTVKQLVRLLQDGFVICSDGWRYKFAGKGAPLVNFILLKPDGGVLFIKVSSGKSKVNEAEAQLVQQVVRWLQRVVGLAHGCVGVVSPYAAQQLEDTMTRLSKASTAAVRKELTNLKLGVVG
ncbi:hypothetical protein HaLaN_06363 [Haematococcus lacustris]|uniref:Uncharacterized protein n=1 Tax=Haematococcus lacustris TaxID=44745 RepID=A0A699YVB8_HAELA|nr:hypothetical protein HaLaN_06363 [Haematococcus lacustris]